MFTYSGKYDVLFPLAGVITLIVSWLTSFTDDNSVELLDAKDRELVTALCLCKSGCDLFGCLVELTMGSSPTLIDSILLTEV